MNYTQIVHIIVQTTVALFEVMEINIDVDAGNLEMGWN
jgi:hypothetical protein